MAACRAKKSIWACARSSGGLRSWSDGCPASSSTQKTPPAAIEIAAAAIRGMEARNDIDNFHAIVSFRLMPGGIRVIGGHRQSELCCVGTEILFVNSAGCVDNKGHHTR